MTLADNCIMVTIYCLKVWPTGSIVAHWPWLAHRLLLQPLDGSLHRIYDINTAYRLNVPLASQHTIFVCGDSSNPKFTQLDQQTYRISSSGSWTYSRSHMLAGRMSCANIGNNSCSGMKKKRRLSYRGL